MSSKKISDFTSQTAYLSGDQLTIVRNGTNYKIDTSLLATYLGVTGTITPNPNAGADILEQPSAVLNTIRGLEDGKGTQVGLTALNNVKVDHNFVNGTGGIDLIADITSAQTLFRSLTAGSGISIAIDDESISISSNVSGTALNAITTSHITSGNETVICNNTASIDVTLDLTPTVGDVVTVKRKDAVVIVKGTIDGVVDQTLNVVGYALKVVFDGTEWSEI